MGYHIAESYEGRSRSQDGATREYRITWFDDDPSSPNYVVPNPNSDIYAAPEETPLPLAHSTPDTAWTALSLWMSTEAKSPREPLHVPLEQRTLIVNSLYGFRSNQLRVDEVPGSEGREFTGFASWGVVNTAGASSRSNSSSSSEEEEITDDPESEVKKETSMSAQQASQTAEYLPLIFMFSREQDPEGTGSVQGKLPEFPVGGVNAVQGEEGGAPKLKGVDYSPPAANVNIRYEITGTPPKAAWVQKITDAANECVLNQDFFRLGNILYAPREIAFVSADISTNSSNVTSVDLGFAVGRRTALNLQQVTGIWKVLQLPFVHGTPDWWVRVVNNTFLHYDENSGNLNTYLNAQQTGTDTVAMAVNVNTAMEPGEYDYVGPHDHVWQYTKSVTTDEVIETQFDQVCVHSLWPYTQFKVLFGAIGL